MYSNLIRADRLLIGKKRISPLSEITAAYHRYAWIHSNNSDSHINKRTAERIFSAVLRPYLFSLNLAATIVFGGLQLLPCRPFLLLSLSRTCALCYRTIIGWDASILSYSRQPHFSGWVPQARNYSPCPRIGVTSETGKFKSLPNITGLLFEVLPRRRSGSSGQ